MIFPKITIVTPSFNQDQFLEYTIQSVLNQNYPNLEYIIIDGGSSDHSVEIIKKYETHLAYWVSEKDKGLYDALQKGFSRSTGEIMGWINSDDLLHPNSLFSIGEIFSSFKDVNWIMGMNTVIDEKGRTLLVSDLTRWSKYKYLNYDFKWIQQESTFWRKSLWTSTGGFSENKNKYAGDLDLWMRFFKKEQLFSIRCLIGGFRIRNSGQLSVDHYSDYLDESNKIIQDYPITPKEDTVVKKIRIMKLFKNKYISSFLPGFINNKIDTYIFSLYEFPPVIQYNFQKSAFQYQK